MTATSSMLIAGEISGDVRVVGALTIAAEGSVEGDIHGSDVTVQGTVRGSIDASGRLRIAGGGKVIGSISARVVVIDDGGSLEGRCAMGSGSSAERPATKSASDSFLGRIVDDDDDAPDPPVLVLNS